MRSIRRELHRRRPKRLAPARSVVATKPTAGKDPRRRPPQRVVPPSTISPSRGSAGTDASPPQPRPRASSRRRCSTHASPPPAAAGPAPSSTTGSAACQATPGVPEHLIPGTVVRVRTRTGTLKTRHVLVLWLKATIVASTHGGYEVVYDGNWPRGDPKGTVHVEQHHVRLMNPSSPSPTATPKRKEMPRPTTAGKSLRLIRSHFPEMELPTTYED